MGSAGIMANGLRLKILAVATLIAAIGNVHTAVRADTARAEEELIGSAEYGTSCAVCHGVGGQGDGPMAKFLNVPPSDLTQLSAKHDGKFPLLEVFQLVDGRAITSAHGTRAMPIWGDRYKAEMEDMYGPYGSETAVRSRILELIFYLQQIQR